MSEIQSNYPRESVVGVDRQDIQRLGTITRSGLVWTIANGVSITILMSSLLIFKNLRSLFTLYGGLALVFFATGLILAVAIFCWVRLAHRIVCRLRNVETRMSSNVTAGLAAVPVILGYLPLSYALEFVLIRSKSIDTPVMKWYSAWSKSWEANVFAFIAFLSAACFFCSFFSHLYANERQMLIYTSTGLRDIALVVGLRMVLKSNKNLKILFESRLP